MTRRIGFSKVIAGVVIAVAMTLTSAFSGVVFAGIGVGELQECTISKSMDAAPGAGGLDIYIWQKAPNSSEDVAAYYNRIAFQYAKTGNGR